MIPALTEDGVLPHGRHSTTIEEVAERFAPAGCSPQRAKVWDDWIRVTRIVGSQVHRLPAAWLGGSFVTDKPEPNDVDSVYVIESFGLLQLMAPQAASILAAVAGNRLPGVSVDSFIMDWQPSTGPDLLHPLYAQTRGYWDDLWVRRRSLDSRLDAVPRRGYLEVIIDGYQ